MQELKAEDERLKTDQSADDTPEKSANYTRSQMLLNTTTPSTKEQKQEEIWKEMKQLEALFHSL